MNMKKAMAMLLALVLVFACTTVAGAVGQPYGEGGIVVKDPTCTEDGYYRYYYEDPACTIKADKPTDYFGELLKIPALGHDWDEGKVTIEPACETKGEMTYTCKREGCDATKTEEIKELGHDWKYLAGEQPLPFPCVAPGTLHETCVRCGALSGNTMETEMVPHKWDGIHHYDMDGCNKAMCTTPEHWYEICTVCKTNSEIKTGEIDPNSHNWGELKVDLAPTCTEQGLYYQLCLDCKIARHDVWVPANGHTWDDGVVTKKPTCMEEGVMTYTCVVCNATKEEPIKKLDHITSEGDKVTVAFPDCENSGLADYYCSYGCGTLMIDDAVIPALGHLDSTVDVVKEPTCTEVGYQRHWCLREIPGANNTSHVCQTVVTEEYVDAKNLDVYNGEVLEIIPKTEHQWGEWITRNETTGEALGYWIRECTVCGKQDFKTQDESGIEWTIDESTKVAPTCTEAGKYDVVGTKDGVEIDRRHHIIPARGHDFSVEVETEPTCETAGSKGLKCSRCDVISESEEIAALGHDWVEVIEESVAPTCEAVGKKVEKCSRCDATQETEVAATGHDFSIELIIEPTCDTDGSKVMTCSVCGAAEGEPEVIPALGHDFSVDMPDEAVAPTCTTVGKTVKKCSRCDAREETEVAMVEHTLETVPATEPTASKAGNKEYQICTVCNKAFDTTGAEINPADMVIAPEGGLSDEDGTFKYYDQAGEVMTSYSGLVDFEGGKFFVRNGILDTNVNGVQSPDAKTFYFFANGQICDGANGFAEYDGQWFVIKEGVLQTGFNGLFEYMGAKFWVAAGQKTNYTGLMKTEEGWLYLVEGQFYPITDLVSYDGAIFYVKDGKLQESFTGTVRDFNGTEFNVVNGMVK